jgi:hypothetical protein
MCDRRAEADVVQAQVVTFECLRRRRRAVPDAEEVGDVAGAGSRGEIADEPVDPHPDPTLVLRAVAAAVGKQVHRREYERGEGLGADAQAGWTALTANLIVEAWPAD